MLLTFTELYLMQVHESVERLYKKPARSESCIAEAYLTEECVRFCSEFLKKQQVMERNLIEIPS